MSEVSKHTLGPWIRDKSSGLQCCVRSQSGRRIATTMVQRNPYGENQRQQNDANANLIAAAPDLLASVKLFRDTIEYLIKADRVAGDDEGARLKSFTLESVEGLIAKAEGRS